MLRRSRVYLDGVPLHIVQRGENKKQKQKQNRPEPFSQFALNQNQPLGNSCFYFKIESTTGQSRKTRPCVQRDETPSHNISQEELKF